MDKTKENNQKEINNEKKIRMIIKGLSKFDQIKLRLNDHREFTGLFIKIKDNFIILKLNNGYNVGFKLKNINEIKKEKINLKGTNQSIGKNVQRNYNPNDIDLTKSNKEGHDKKFKKVLIIHTGGTIASKVDYKTGGVKSLIKAEEILNIVPELKYLAEIKTIFLMNVFSEDFEFKHYNLLLKTIKDNYNLYDGFIITHGTDTMHYTSAALKFAIDNLKKPIILVGAQRSSDRPSTDSRLNLISAIYFIAKTDYHGVGICMHYNINDSKAVILDGFNVRKMHTSRRDAFKQIGKKPIALVDYFKKQIIYMGNPNEINNRKDNNTLKNKNINLKEDKKTKFNINQKENDSIRINYYNNNLKVGILYVHPSINPMEISCFKNYDGVLILGTGLGHISINENNLSKNGRMIFNKLNELIKKGTIVAMSKQTIYGRVNMNVYSTGRILKDIGVIGNLTNMTPETAYIKICYLLSNKKRFNNFNKIKEAYENNLKGEQILIESVGDFIN